MLPEFCQIEDAELLSQIHCAAFSDGWNVEKMRNMLASQSMYAIRLEEFAFIIFQIVLDECEIHSLAVRPNEQRKGRASELLTKLVSACKGMSCKKIFLEVSVANSAAISLYKKFSFIEYSIRKNYYADSSDAALLQLTL